MCWSVITFAHALPCSRPWTAVCLPIIAVRTYPPSGGRLCPSLGLTVEAHYVLMTITLKNRIDADPWDVGGLDLPSSLSSHQTATGGIPALPPLRILFWAIRFGGHSLFVSPYFFHPKRGEASIGCLLSIAPTLTVLYARTRSTLMGVTTYVVPKNTT